MQSTRHSCQILTNLEFSRQIFRIILRYDKKYVLVFMQSTHHSCQILMTSVLSTNFSDNTQI